ncbi:MAG: nickel pincer cofactor biosynthesis protein LarC [Deltaproteobacteria bacterium]|nr:nickel pincer cofactor biosynthesis protein LarC [Deltaproteobacteria bacterium]
MKNCRIAFFDCFCGISGDMTLGAFVDLGVPVKYLEDELYNLPLGGFKIETGSVFRNGIKAQKIFVAVSDQTKSRNYTQIKILINQSPLSEKVKQLSLDMFKRVAVAEAKIHGCSLEKVHFHEVGGIDALVDIVGTALCIEYLGIEKVVASRLPLGQGFVECSHGTIPVPSPATLAILKGIPTYGTDIPCELVTPTGAAIITCLAQSFDNRPEMVIEKIGYGAGTREIKSRPNLLRITVGKALDGNNSDTLTHDRVTMVESCIDDMNPEIFGFLMEMLFADGALDVVWTPVFMKKNRPGTLVQVLCRTDQREKIIRRILSETTSLGVRFHEMERCLLPRESVTVQTRFGEIKGKKIRGPGTEKRMVPEFEECRTFALEKGIPIRKAYEQIQKALDQG